MREELDKYHKYEEDCAKKEELDEEKIKTPNAGRHLLL